MVKRKTGLGVDAFFPVEDEGIKTTIEQPSSTSAPPPRRRKSSTSLTRKTRSAAKKAIQSKSDPDENMERRPAWIRLDHLEKLDILKHRERGRLRREKKRVARSTLIDEAIDLYLAEMEK